MNLLVAGAISAIAFVIDALGQQAGTLVVRVQRQPRAIDLATGAVGKAIGDMPPQPPPLRQRLHGLEYTSVPTQAVFSPDGTRVAHVLRDFGTEAPNGEIVVTDLHGDHAVAITSDGGDNEDPLWSFDGRRLLFSARAPGGRRRVCVFHFADGGTTELADDGLMLSPRPRFLPDGYLLAIRSRAIGEPTAEAAFACDLVVDPCVPGRRPTVVQAAVPQPVAMEPSANGLLVWLLTESQLLRIDRRSGKTTNTWNLPELGDAEWPVRLGQLAVHPDGDLAAVTFWGLGWKQGQEGGRDVVALVEVPGSKAPKDAVPVIRRVVVGPDPRLLGFAPTSSSASATKAEAAKPATERR